MPSTQLAEREFYHELTPKQKAIIDAYAENPDAGYSKIAKRATELMDNGEVSRSYTRPVLDVYSHIAEEQRSKKENGREKGEERTEGYPFDRMFEERDEETVEPTKETLQVDLSANDVRNLLDGTVTKELRTELIDKLVQSMAQRNGHD